MLSGVYLKICLNNIFSFADKVLKATALKKRFGIKFFFDISLCSCLQFISKFINAHFFFLSNLPHTGRIRCCVNFFGIAFGIRGLWRTFADFLCSIVFSSFRMTFFQFLFCEVNFFYFSLFYLFCALVLILLAVDDF